MPSRTVAIELAKRMLLVKDTRGKAGAAEANRVQQEFERWRASRTLC